MPTLYRPSPAPHGRFLVEAACPVNGEHGECKHGKYFILKLVYQANKRRDCGYAVVLNFLDDGNVDKGMRIIRADTAKSSSL